MSDFQSILIPVTEAEPLAQPFRRAGDWSSAHGVPAHMTIAGPWPLSLPLPVGALEDLRVAIAGERYTLGSAGTLGDAICLFPEEDGALLRWRAKILQTVGIADEVDETWRIHLTVCRVGREGDGSAIEEEMGNALPLRCEVRGLLLAQMLGDSRVTIEPL
jgi:hypothetical protein